MEAYINLTPVDSGVKKLPSNPTLTTPSQTPARRYPQNLNQHIEQSSFPNFYHSNDKMYSIITIIYYKKRDQQGRYKVKSTTPIGRGLPVVAAAVPLNPDILSSFPPALVLDLTSMMERDFKGWYESPFPRLSMNSYNGIAFRLTRKLWAALLSARM